MTIKREAVKESDAVLDAKALMESIHTPAPSVAEAEAEPADDKELSFPPNFMPTRTTDHLGNPRRRSYLIRHGERILREGI